jgi:hypothetical protein|tara:strand:- start:740 stop:1186 length:447 start_codon:yes stop_codon:yes gene_type:complete
MKELDMAYTNTKLVYEVLDAVEKATKKEEKIQILKQNDTWALKDVLRATYDDAIQFLLPPGAPPYIPSKEGSIPSNLLKQHKNLTYIVKGGQGEKMPGFKREKVFINMLESVHPKEAELLLKMINKESLRKGITKKLVQEAFPGLISK